MSQLVPGPSGPRRQVSNPLPSLDDLAIEEPSPQELLSAAAAARAAATPAQLEALGILPDDDELIAFLNGRLDELFDTGGQDSQEAGPSSTGYKVYKSSSFADFVRDSLADYGRSQPQGSSTTAVEISLDEEFARVVAELGFGDIDPAIQKEYLEVARRNCLKISAATAEWKNNSLSAPDDSLCPASGNRPAKFDLIGSIATCLDILIEVGKHLSPRDIVTLYSVSRDFHATVNARMQSCVLAWVRTYCRDAVRIFGSDVYLDFLIRDPAGRARDDDDGADDMSHITHPERERPKPVTDNTAPRTVVGLRWLQMAISRARIARDILAVLARHGHRTLSGTHTVLMKISTLMDLATSAARVRFCKRLDFFSDEELIMAQLFVIKLHLLCNDPVLGPGSPVMAQVLLGQRSLSTLWAMLRRKRYLSREEIMSLKVRYDVGPSPAQIANGVPVYGVPIQEMGVGHLEGWGRGQNHLLRPDECIALECARRGLCYTTFTRKMMAYGHVDPVSGASLVPTLDELYMSDDELPPAEDMVADRGKNGKIYGGAGNVPFGKRNWTPKDVRKANWDKLTKEEKDMILDEEWQAICEEWDLESGAIHKNLQDGLKNLTEALNEYKDLTPGVKQAGKQKSGDDVKSEAKDDDEQMCEDEAERSDPGVGDDLPEPMDTDRDDQDISDPFPSDSQATDEDTDMLEENPDLQIGGDHDEAQAGPNVDMPPWPTSTGAYLDDDHPDEDQTNEDYPDEYNPNEDDHMEEENNPSDEDYPSDEYNPNEDDYMEQEDYPPIPDPPNTNPNNPIPNIQTPLFPPSAPSPQSLDDLLLSMADADYTPSELSFDWTAHLREATSTVDDVSLLAAGELVDPADSENIMTVGDLFGATTTSSTSTSTTGVGGAEGGDGGGDGDEEDGEEDSRVVALRDYYRQW